MRHITDSMIDALQMSRAVDLTQISVCDPHADVAMAGLAWRLLDR